MDKDAGFSTGIFILKKCTAMNLAYTLFTQAVTCVLTNSIELIRYLLFMACLKLVLLFHYFD